MFHKKSIKKYLYLPFISIYIINLDSFLIFSPWLIRMSHWRYKMVDGAEFWISCKRPVFLSSFGILQVIQNKRPWTVGIWHMWQLDLKRNSGKNFRFQTRDYKHKKCHFLIYFNRPTVSGKSYLGRFIYNFWTSLSLPVLF